MTELLIIAVLCLSASTAVLAASVPFLFWKAFRLEARMEAIRQEQDKCIATLDDTLAQLLQNVGVPAEKQE